MYEERKKGRRASSILYREALFPSQLLVRPAAMHGGNGRESGLGRVSVMDDLHNIFSDVKRHALTERERTSMRNNLLAHMNEYPARAPLSVRMLDAVERIGDALGAQQRARMRFIPATLALFLVLGVGTTYAAEGALPGDALYSVKLNLNESLKGAFAFSDAAKVSWETERLERRLQEAETLVAAGELTPVAQATLETEIHAAVDAFDKKVARIAARADEAAVVAAQSDLEASLIGHAEVLVVLAEDNEEAELAARPIIASVLARAEKVQQARAASEATVAANRDNASLRAAAYDNKERALQVVTAVRTKADSHKDEATTTAEVAAESAGIAEAAITVAEEKLQQGDYGSAFTVFQEAIRTARTAEVSLDASKRLNTDVKMRSFTRTARPSDASAALMMETATTATFEAREGDR